MIAGIVIGTVSDDTTFKMIGLQRAKNFIDEEVANKQKIVQDNPIIIPRLVKKSQEICEWKQTTYGAVALCRDSFLRKVHVGYCSYKYCPYCGKEIKIIPERREEKSGNRNE